MRTSVLAVVFVVLASCASSPPPRIGHFETSDRAAIQSLLDNQIAAWNRGDLPGYMDGYARTPGLAFTSGGDIRLGWQQALDHYQSRYTIDPKGMGTLAFAIESITPVGADGAVVLGRWELVDNAHAGNGVFTVVLERRAEGWRIVHDHTSIAPDHTSIAP